MKKKSYKKLGGTCKFSVGEAQKDDEEEKMDVEEKEEETSQFALSKANIPKVMSRISAFIEPYGDFVYVTSYPNPLRS